MLISDLKLLLRFNTTSIFEEKSQTSMSILGDNSTPVISDAGYLMQDDQYLFGDGIFSNGYDLDFDDEVTIGFWLYPINIGLAIDESTNDLLSIEMPLLNFVDTSSASTSVIEITEHTQDSGNNSLKISERGGYSAFSEEYSANTWHYFWITHSPTGLRIFIDGIEHTLQDEEGVFSANLTPGFDAFLNLYINHSLDGYSSSVAKNKGTIDDVFLLNVMNSSESDMQRSINDGIEYVLDDNFTNIDIYKSSIYFNNPETITVNSMVDDLSYIFVGRNDGKILRGSALFWETRRSFSNADEYEYLGLDPNVASDDTTTSGRRSGFLQLVNTTIRL